MSRAQYPDDYNPPERGRCEKCGYVTKGWTKVWLMLCPNHWQELLRKAYGR
jgi:hypothetical protein